MELYRPALQGECRRRDLRDEAFKECRELKTIVIPAGTVRIEMRRVFMKSWKIALALGMSALVLSGCGGKGNSSSESDSAQVCPAYYFDFENESFYYVDNALAKKPKSYPFPSDYLFSNAKGCITEDGKWIYVYGNCYRAR
ncbi:MAG: hypothetical protein IJ198_03445 [Lachnospiraceae bacterium]|nr:hypothetical protein [Lachnospiraceae bacterium]